MAPLSVRALMNCAQSVMAVMGTVEKTTSESSLVERCGPRNIVCVNDYAAVMPQVKLPIVAVVHLLTTYL